MPTRFRLLRALAATLVLALPQARAQGTATLPSSDLAYRDLDRLSELGYLDSVIVGQRPYSRREIGRILRVARDRSTQLGERAQSQRLTDLELAIGDGILRRLERRFSREIDSSDDVVPVLQAVDDVALSATYTDAERRGWLAAHTRPTEATIGSLLPRRLGSQLVPGTTASFEIAQRLEPTTWLAFAARERAQYAWAKDTTQRMGTAEVLLGSVRARVRNVAVEAGRSQFTWSQTQDAGLFLASDAPALDQISVSSDEPFALPWALRRLGLLNATVLLADLGPSRVRSHSKLLAYKVSIAPSRNAEIGATFMNHFGGEGGRASSLGDRIIDFLPFVDIFRTHNYYDSTRALDVDSDKLLGVDGRFRLGGLHGVVVSGELLIDDFDVHRISRLVTGGGSQTFSAIVPRFFSPLLTLELTAKHMGVLTYTHTALQSGITTRGRLLGDELGPDAKAFGGRLTWQPTAALHLGIDGRAAIYSNADYDAYYVDADSTQYEIRKISRTSDELRDRGGASILLQSDAGPAVSVRFVTERARNYRFEGYRHTESAGEVAVHLLF